MIILQLYTNKLDDLGLSKFLETRLNQKKIYLNRHITSKNI